MNIGQRRMLCVISTLVSLCASCKRSEEQKHSLSVDGLVVALSEFETDGEGRPTARPKAARAEIWQQHAEGWKLLHAFEDKQSNVFHKLMVYPRADKVEGLLSVGGTDAHLKLWKRNGQAWTAKTLWSPKFGGKVNRLRDVEIADVLGQGVASIVVATHDQGVVALLTPKGKSALETRELDRQPNTFVHEVEVGDVDGDGIKEIYATPSQPNRLDGTLQKGEVVRYVPAKNQGRQVVADLGDRHAKEILVADIDGNGRDELYVSVEAHTQGADDAMTIKEPVEIRRYDAQSKPRDKNIVASIDDRLCRFLTVGDVDGDGKKEIVAAAFRSGVWLLKPGKTPGAPWTKQSIEKVSSGFEHAALLADLNHDGRDELYVASDDQAELRQYVWQKGSPTPKKTVILRRKRAGTFFTWNMMAVPFSWLR